MEGPRADAAPPLLLVDLQCDGLRVGPVALDDLGRAHLAPDEGPRVVEVDVREIVCQVVHAKRAVAVTCAWHAG